MASKITCKKFSEHNDHEMNDKKIRHYDHEDYLMGGRLHYNHNDHCDDHGNYGVYIFKQYWKYILMMTLIVSYFFVEYIIGYIYSYISLQSDAFHMLSDGIALTVGLIVKVMSNRTKNILMTYGWGRMEIVGALINSTFLVASLLLISLEAGYSLITFNPDTVESLGEDINLVLIVAGVGLGINLLGLIIFSLEHSHSHNNLNTRALLLHVVGDFVGSIAVIGSGLLIKYLESPYKYLADPIASFLIVSLLLGNVIPIFWKSINILSNRVPVGLDLDQINKEILSDIRILDIHEFHVWSLDFCKNVGTLHVIIDPNNDIDQLKNSINLILEKYKIKSITIQFEYQHCNDKE